MFEAYSTTSTIYNQNNPIGFTNVSVSDDRINLTNGNTISIKCPGKYLIKFNGVAQSNTDAAPFTIQLFKNGVAVPEAFSTITADSLQTVMFDKVVTVPRSCCVVDNTTTLQVIATSSAAGTVTLSNIIVIKLR